MEDRFGHGESQSMQTRKLMFLVMCMDGEYTMSCFQHDCKSNII